ncbi:hypothetical protein F4604DRAFT_1738938 [Suillus subluteus]|nr:hypothetical protein F4604DRAFT_1738938 [Suillus subluteus]
MMFVLLLPGSASIVSCSAVKSSVMSSISGLLTVAGTSRPCRPGKLWTASMIVAIVGGQHPSSRGLRPLCCQANLQFGGSLICKMQTISMRDSSRMPHG